LHKHIGAGMLAAMWGSPRSPELQPVNAEQKANRYNWNSLLLPILNNRYLSGLISVR
jgi:hypothetical protein